MTGAPINIGMRAAIYGEPLEPDRGQAVRERHVDQPINASVGISPSIVLKRHANGSSRARDDRSAPAHPWLL